MTAEDAGTAVRRNENADSEPDGNDLEEVSFEVVAAPKGNVSKDGVAEVCDEGANADLSFLTKAPEDSLPASDRVTSAEVAAVSALDADAEGSTGLCWKDGAVWRCEESEPLSISFFFS